MTYLSNYQACRNALENGEASCVSIVAHYLHVIKEKKTLNAFVEVFESEAQRQAIEIDEKLKNGSAGKLAGMVIAIKDNICYKGHVVSASSKILENFCSLYSATVVERLLAEDAIIIGRTNCDEFAMGSSTENSAFGPTRNALDESRVPGGSSGGSAVAVQAGMCMVSLGSDTGGSIRQPASFTGVVGFKPTYGLVSRHGLLAYASSFDQIGPFANNVEDVALVMDTIAGHDEYDSTVSSAVPPSYSHAPIFKNKAKIAYIKDCLEREGLDPEIKKAVEKLIEELRASGHTVEAVEFPYLDYLVPAYYVLTTAEASSNLARYDGIHYGYRSEAATDLATTYKKSRSEGFGEEVKRRIMLGTFALSSGYYDAYYAKGQKVRQIIRRKTDEILNDYDYILLPTTPTTPFKIGEKANDPIAMYLQDIYTVQANLAGNPAISLPMGKHSNGLPFGIQLIARRFQEDKLLPFSAYLLKNWQLINNN